MSKTLLLKLAFVSALSGIATAQADVLTFNDTAGADLPGANFVGDYFTYFERTSVYQGYSFTTPEIGLWYQGYLNTVMFCGGTAANCAYNGTDSLTATPALNVKRADGQSFSLNGLDLDNGRDTSVAEAQASFTVTGFKTDGTTISTTVTLDNLPNSETYGTAAAFNHFDFVGFTNLSSFEIERITPNAWGYLTIDNLNVSAATPVPEPSSWLMISLGLLGLGVHAKRRKA